MTTDTSVRRKVGSRRGHKVNALTFSILCKLMMDGTRTCHELAEDSGLHVLTVYDWSCTAKVSFTSVCGTAKAEPLRASSSSVRARTPSAHSKPVHKSVQNTALARGRRS